MASANSKRLGFFWGEDRITVVEFDKNAPVKVIVSPLGSKSSAASPFSSNLTEEIQITAMLQKMLKDNAITGGSFYVSLPMKEIILRSFMIPFVKTEDIQNAIKFEARKYMPFDIQDISFVYHATPVGEGPGKRLQVIFYAARKEALDRYDRIFKQIKAEGAYFEPYMVSLSKSLLFQKEITPTDHVAFLTLDNALGRICFIDKGIPQFNREFSIKSAPSADENADANETLNSKIINEVGNSFDFYARQFNGERIEKMLIVSDFVQMGLLNSLETELKVKIKKYSPVVTTGIEGQSNDMGAVYALGACVAPPMDSLAGFNFIGDKKNKPSYGDGVVNPLGSYKELIGVLLACVVALAGGYFVIQLLLKTPKLQYDQLSAKGGVFSSESTDNIKAELQDNIDKLTQLKSIRTESDLTKVLFKVASHLPKGAKLSSLTVNYDQNGPNNAQITIEMSGSVFNDDPNEEFAAVDQIFSDFKNDKDLSKYVNAVHLGPLQRQTLNGRQITGFTIQCT